MLNLRKHRLLRGKSLLGRFLRLPFLVIPDNMVVSILSGPLRGMKWVVGSHNKSVWLGTYERNQTLKFAEKCKDHKIFWDLGAHVGYYTLLFKKINQDSTVFSFDPVERNFRYFQKHVRLNNVNKIFHFQKAVSDSEGNLKFAKGNHVGGKLSSSGDIDVPVVRLSNLLEQELIAFPDIIKMDIEGAEFDVLNDLQDLLMSRKRPVIFLSTHGKEVHDNCLSLLKKMNFRITPLDSKNLSRGTEFLIEPC